MLQIRLHVDSKIINFLFLKLSPILSLSENFIQYNKIIKILNKKYATFGNIITDKFLLFGPLLLVGLLLPDGVSYPVKAYSPSYLSINSISSNIRSFPLLNIYFNVLVVDVHENSLKSNLKVCHSFVIVPALLVAPHPSKVTYKFE